MKTFPRVALYRKGEYAVRSLIVFRAAPKNMRAAIALSTRPGENGKDFPRRSFRNHLRGVTMGLN